MLLDISEYPFNMDSPSSTERELVRQLLDEIATKWSIRVLTALCGGPMRFNALRRELGGVTQKALTQCLRRLEANGIVSRSVVSISPVAVAYEISPFGRSLEEPFRTLLNWTKENQGEMVKNQKDYRSQKP
jgi:DNA-binding HxlR family transcriptional regulator